MGLQVQDWSDSGSTDSFLTFLRLSLVSFRFDFLPAFLFTVAYLYTELIQVSCAQHIKTSSVAPRFVIQMTAQQIKIHLFANFLKICISVVIFRASLIVEKLRLRCHLYTECSLKAKQKKNVQNKAGKKKRKLLKNQSNPGCLVENIGDQRASPWRVNKPQ